MKYLSFSISNYRAIESALILDLTKTPLIPLVGLNECGKTTILQAIYAFDYTNDKENEGKHLKDTKNLYQTTEKGESIVTATIDIKYSELKLILEGAIESHNEPIQDSINKIKGELQEEGADDEVDENVKETREKINNLKKQLVPTSFILDKSKYDNQIVLSRNLNTKQYSFENIEWIPENLLHHALAEEIIILMPYILYNDDFMDRPLNSIKIPDAEPENVTGWLAIFNRLFATASEGYTLFSIVKETDSRRRDAILSDVQEYLNTTLAKAWKQFSLSSTNNIAINLRLAANNEKGYSNILEIKIVEKIGQKDRFFDVIDRSKGFLWFYNFVMKLEFNPKIISGNEKHTVYLLDEPGSYLHYSAQEKLCKKLVDISNRHGTVIYCTHSHTLLNPEMIPLNSIYIIEKDKTKKIKAIPLTKFQSKTETNSAFQPIHEALQISAFQYGTKNSKIIAVEGIYDKYAIELMLDLSDISILPGTGANSIIKNIQFLNAYDKTYIAIWDNDEEGRKQHSAAKKFFGDFEAEKFDLLPLLGKGKRKMEDMFANEDFEIMKRELDLEEPVTYEKLISTLFFSKKKTRSSIRLKVSSETQNRFSILESIIMKRFSVSEEQSKMKD
jgi:predicted ATPase